MVPGVTVRAMTAGDDARAKIQQLLVTGDNRLKQGVAPEKVRESYEQALAAGPRGRARGRGAAARRGPARRSRPAAVPTLTVTSDPVALQTPLSLSPHHRRESADEADGRSTWPSSSARSSSSSVGSFAIVAAAAGSPHRAAGDRLDRAVRLRPRAARRPLRVRGGLGRALQPGRVARDVPRPAAVDATTCSATGSSSSLGAIARLARRADRVQPRRRSQATTTQSPDDWAGALPRDRRSRRSSSLVILQSTKSERFGARRSIAIPLTLVAIHFARSRSAARRSTRRGASGRRWSAPSGTDFWIYFVGPPLGAIIGWIVYTVVVEGDTDLRDDFEAARRSASRRDETRAAAGGPSRLPTRTSAWRRPSRRRGPPARARLRSARPAARTSCRSAASRAAVVRAAGARPPSRSASTIASSSSGSTSTPASGGTNSGGPPTRVATTDRPHAIASSSAWPNGSTRLGWQTTSRRAEPVRRPRRGRPRRRCVTPGRPASASRSGPSPTNASVPSPARSNACARRRTFLRSVSDPTQRNPVPSGCQPTVARASLAGLRREPSQVDAAVDHLHVLPRASGTTCLQPRAEPVRDRDDAGRAADDESGRARTTPESLGVARPARAR